METCCGLAMALSMPGYKVTGWPPPVIFPAFLRFFLRFWIGRGLLRSEEGAHLHAFLEVSR